MFNLRKANKVDESKIMDLVKSVLSDYGLKTNPQQTDKDLSDIENMDLFNTIRIICQIDVTLQ